MDASHVEIPVEFLFPEWDKDTPVEPAAADLSGDTVQPAVRPMESASFMALVYEAPGDRREGWLSVVVTAPLSQPAQEGANPVLVFLDMPQVAATAATSRATEIERIAAELSGAKHRTCVFVSLHHYGAPLVYAEGANEAQVASGGVDWVRTAQRWIAAIPSIAFLGKAGQEAVYVDVVGEGVGAAVAACAVLQKDMHPRVRKFAVVDPVWDIDEVSPLPGMLVAGMVGAGVPPTVTVPMVRGMSDLCRAAVTDGNGNPVCSVYYRSAFHLFAILRLTEMIRGLASVWLDTTPHMLTIRMSGIAKTFERHGLVRANAAPSSRYVSVNPGNSGNDRWHVAAAELRRFLD